MATPDQMDVEETGEGISPEEQDILDSIVASGLEYFYGDNRASLEQLLSKPQEGANDSVPERVAQAVYRVLMPASQEIQQQGVEVDIGLMFGAATELIDALFEMAIALGVAEGTEDEKAAALFAIVQLHMADSESTPESRAAAQEALQELMDDPDSAEGIEWVKGAIERTGGSPEQAFVMGEQMASASQDAPAPAPQQPQRGLMGG